MAARKPPEAAAKKLQELTATTRELQQVEARAEELRTQRNMEVYEAIHLGATERLTAQTGNVDPSYAHRCAVHKGKPTSGHKS